MILRALVSEPLFISRGRKKGKSSMAIRHLQPVAKPESGITLVEFLAARLGITKRQAKDLLNTRSVLVNRRRIWMAKYRLNYRDTVSIQEFPIPGRDASDAKILYEDNDLLIVDKRPGRLSNGCNSLESLLRATTGNVNIQAVHRLDRDTSGCLIFAKNAQTAEAMIALFRQKAVRKTYHVIAIGRVEPREMTLRFPVDGEPACTNIRTLDSNRRATHLIATPETGRTHQIRKHLRQIGHPVAGDRQYGTGRRLGGPESVAGRQMLHASTVEFTHPTSGRRIIVRAPLPRDFRAALVAFGLT